MTPISRVQDLITIWQNPHIKKWGSEYNKPGCDWCRGRAPEPPRAGPADARRQPPQSAAQSGDARCLGGGVNHERGDDPMKIRRGRRVTWFMCCGAVCDQLHIQPATRQPAPY